MIHHLTTKTQMPLREARSIAIKLCLELDPHCHRIKVAGSIRRREPVVGDIEIVCIPKPYDVGLFTTGVAAVINQYPKLKGELPCKYTQRALPEGINLDLFMVTEESWGLQLAVRTGPALYSHKVLATGWKKRGYKAENGLLHGFGKVFPIREEHELYRRLGLKYIEPWERHYP